MAASKTFILPPFFNRSAGVRALFSDEKGFFSFPLEGASPFSLLRNLLGFRRMAADKKGAFVAPPAAFLRLYPAVPTISPQNRHG